MWADAQRDGRPAEYRSQMRSESSVIPFLVASRKVLLTPTARVSCSNAANIGEHKTWTQSEFCTVQNSIRGQDSQNVHSVPAQETAKYRAVWLSSG